MIIVKLWGGMCNQMFQYAFGYALSKKVNDDVAFETAFFDNQPSFVGKRKIISADYFNVSKLNFCSRPLFAKYFENKYINRLFRYTTGCSFSFIADFNMVIEKHLHFYTDIPYKKGVVNYYDGYWQSGRYFQEYRNEILAEFAPPAHILKLVNEWKSNLNSTKTVAVHIRRGDYLNKINQINSALYKIKNDISYYLRAMDYMVEKLGEPKFCLFSDDIEWCKSVLGTKYKDIIFVQNKGVDAALLDLYSISKCEHGIMSPSSFSWWGNWLRCNNPNGIVICPKGIIGNEDFVDNKWVRL